MQAESLVYTKCSSNTDEDLKLFWVILVIRALQCHAICPVPDPTDWQLGKKNSCNSLTLFNKNRRCKKKE